MKFNYLDFAIIILLSFAAIKGYRKGFIESLVGFLGSIVALVLSVKLNKPFAGLLNEKFGILSCIHGFLAQHMPFPLEVSTVFVNNPVGRELFLQKINNMALPAFIKMEIIEEIEEILLSSAQLGLATIGEVFTYLVARTLLNGLALIILWIVLSNLLRLAANILSKSLDNTILGGINRLGGLIITLALNCLGLMIFFGIFTLFLKVLNQGNSTLWTVIGTAINQSVLVSYLLEGYRLLLSRVINLI